MSARLMENLLPYPQMKIPFHLIQIPRNSLGYVINGIEIRHKRPNINKVTLIFIKQKSPYY